MFNQAESIVIRVMKMENGNINKAIDRLTEEAEHTYNKEHNKALSMLADLGAYMDNDGSQWDKLLSGYREYLHYNLNDGE